MLHFNPKPIQWSDDLSYTDMVPPGWKNLWKHNENILNHVESVVNNMEGESTPDQSRVFHAYNYTPLSNVKVVMIGQDPYPQVNDNGDPISDGLAFSSDQGIQRSLSVLLKALKNTHRKIDIKHGNLEHWARQGVLLLNSSLTTKRKPSNEGNIKDYVGKHKNIWRPFIIKTIEELSNARWPNGDKRVLIFVLFGEKAKYFESYIGKHHIVYHYHHPSKAGHNDINKSTLFSDIDSHLSDIGEKPIDWQLN